MALIMFQSAWFSDQSFRQNVFASHYLWIFHCWTIWFSVKLKHFQFVCIHAWFWGAHFVLLFSLNIPRSSEVYLKVQCVEFCDIKGNGLDRNGT